MDDLHEVQFTWPSPEPSVVVVTGTFDEWTGSVHLVKNETGFHGSTRIPWDTKILFKYIIDTNWVCEATSPTETDASGNVNNVYMSPPKPLVEPVTSDATVMTNGAVAASTENTDVPTTPVVADPPSGTKTENTTAAGETGAEAGATLSQLASDLANTVAARDGTSSAFEYVTSALGAAIHSQIGVDPINGDKIAIETPKPDAQFAIPEPQAAEAAPVAAPEITSGVPMQVVPVNAEENNTSNETPSEVAPVALDAPVSRISPATAPPPAAPESEPLESPSTHTPLPAVLPTTESKPSVVALEAAPSLVDATSQPETTPESKNIETSVPEPPVVGLTSEATSLPSETASTEPAIAASVSDTTPVPAKTILTEPAETVSTVPPIAPSVSTEPAAPQPEKTSTNGAAPASTVNSSPSAPVVTPSPSAPATPAKNTQHTFPSSETDSPSSNNSSPSKFGTVGSRKNRKSIFGKFKGLFSGDKEEKEKK